MSDTESLQQRQARIALITTPAMKMLAKLSSPDRMAAMQGILDREGAAFSAVDAEVLMKARGKFAGIFTRIAYQADNRGIVATPEDLVLGAISSFLASRELGCEVHAELAKLAKHWTRKVAGSSTPVELRIGTLRTLTAASSFWGCLLKDDPQPNVPAAKTAAPHGSESVAAPEAAAQGVVTPEVVVPTAAPLEVAAQVAPETVALVTAVETITEAVVATKPGDESIGVLARRR